MFLQEESGAEVTHNDLMYAIRIRLSHLPATFRDRTLGGLSGGVGGCVVAWRVVTAAAQQEGVREGEPRPSSHSHCAAVPLWTVAPPVPPFPTLPPHSPPAQRRDAYSLLQRLLENYGRCNGPRREIPQYSALIPLLQRQVLCVDTTASTPSTLR